jgi:transcriptional regulator with XRE-family HTH domain
MTIVELAKAVGVSPKSIQNWEDDITSPNAVLLTNVLTALKLPFDMLTSIISDDYADL